MHKYSALLIAALLSACADTPTVETAKGPDNKTAYIIWCASNDLGSCMNAAAAQCPTGYTIIENKIFSAARRTLTVECK